MWSLLDTKGLFLQTDLNIVFQSNPLLAGVVDGSSVVVTDHGWTIFGGNARTQAQQLVTADGKWLNGPALFENTAVLSHCALQVKHCFDPV